MTESRTFLLDPGTIQSLLCSGLTDPEDAKDPYLLLPSDLTCQEVGDIGIQVADAAEDERPSRDGYSRGIKKENQVLFSIASVAMQKKDRVTVESIIEYFGNKPRNLSSIANAFVLRRFLKRIPEA